MKSTTPLSKQINRLKFFSVNAVFDDTSIWTSGNANTHCTSFKFKFHFISRSFSNQCRNVHILFPGTRTIIGEAAFADWGWRVPFILSIVMLGISVYIRLQMNESPAFQKMKSEGKTSKSPLSESFGQWKNLKIVLLALFGLVAGQAVVWYSGQFYALFFLTSVLKVDGATANILVAASLIIGTPFFVIFGTLSDKIGRKPIILAGLALAVVTYFPLFEALTNAAKRRPLPHRATWRW